MERPQRRGHSTLSQVKAVAAEIESVLSLAAVAAHGTGDRTSAPLANAAFIFQAHALTAWLLLAIWPFTRLVHAWSVPVSYLGRAPILYRSRRRVPVLARDAGKVTAGIRPDSRG